MRKFLMKSAIPALLLVATALGTTSCEDDDKGARFITETFTVKAQDWSWNSDYARYEYSFPCNRINNYMYELGSINAWVFVIEDGYDDRNRPVQYEVLKQMPYVQSYQQGEVKFTETISCDVSPGWITFFVQASDLSDNDSYLIGYTFKISLFYN